MARKTILSWRKERRYLKELTDEEIDLFRQSDKYKEDENFKLAIDAEYEYRFKQKVAEK